MNRIKAKLVDIKKSLNMHLLTFKKEDVFIKSLILQMNLDFKIGNIYHLYLNPTNLFLSNSRCEAENILEVEVIKIEKGEIISKVICDFKGDLLEVVMLNKDISKKAFLIFKANEVVVKC